MAAPKPFCVICLKKSESVKLFAIEQLAKCRKVLEIREKIKLSMHDVKLPNEVSSTSGYHSQCYRVFTALPKKYRGATEARENVSLETSNLSR